MSLSVERHARISCMMSHERTPSRITSVAIVPTVKHATPKKARVSICRQRAPRTTAKKVVILRISPLLLLMIFSATMLSVSSIRSIPLQDATRRRFICRIAHSSANSSEPYPVFPRSTWQQRTIRDKERTRPNLVWIRKFLSFLPIEGDSDDW